MDVNRETHLLGHLRKGSTSVKSERPIIRVIWRQRLHCLSTRLLKNGSTHRKSMITARREREHHISALPSKTFILCVALGRFKRITIKRHFLYAAPAQGTCTALQKPCLIANNSLINRLLTIHNIGQHSIHIIRSNQKAIRTWEKGLLAGTRHRRVSHKSGRNTLSHNMNLSHTASLIEFPVKKRDETPLITSVTWKTKRTRHCDTNHPTLEVYICLLKSFWIHPLSLKVWLTSIRESEVVLQNHLWGRKARAIRIIHLNKIFSHHSLVMITPDLNLLRLSHHVVDIH